MSIRRDLRLFGILASRKRVTREELKELWDEEKFGPLGSRNQLRLCFKRLEDALNVKICCDRDEAFYVEGVENLLSNLMNCECQS